jgi:predicted enzyme involved in methoxymalonyl-ACP biosynthesis
LFEVTKINGQTLAWSLRKLLDKYGLRKNIIVYIKDERSNLNAMTIVLKVVVNCESFGLE